VSVDFLPLTAGFVTVEPVAFVDEEKGQLFRSVYLFLSLSLSLCCVYQLASRLAALRVLTCIRPMALITRRPEHKLVLHVNQPTGTAM
jgi:hypothetical protein